jgi:porin
MNGARPASAAFIGFSLGLAMGVCRPSFAQTTNSGVGIGPSQQVAQPLQQSVAPSVEHLLGDPGGLRSALESQGIYLLLDGVTEFAGNVSGGTNRGSTFASQVGFEADVDLQRLAGLTGFSTHVVMVNRSGSSDSHLFGDNLEPVQEIYGSGGNVAVHLVSAYAQETLYDRRLDIAIGRMNVENDFASSPLYCNYMNNTLCGDPKALPGGDVGHSAYPDAAWAARVRVRPTPQSYIQTGVYEVNQNTYTDPAFRTGFKFDDSADSGVDIPVEIAYEPAFGADHLPGHYKLGFGYDSSGTFKPFSALLTPNAAPAHRTGNTQLWALVDQMLLRQGKGDMDGIIALGGFIHNDPSNSTYAEEYFAGLLDRGFWAARPEDTMGLLFTYNTVSGALGKVQAEEQVLGLPISNNATGPQTHEIILEANYDIHVVPGVNFQPELQYVVHPNAQADIHNAVVFGFKAHFEF